MEQPYKEVVICYESNNDSFINPCQLQYNLWIGIVIIRSSKKKLNYVKDVNWCHSTSIATIVGLHNHGDERVQLKLTCTWLKHFTKTEN